MNMKSIEAIKSLLGLFIPIPYYTTGLDKNNVLTNNKIVWRFTMTIDHIPLGWIIVLIDLLVKYLIG